MLYHLWLHRPASVPEYVGHVLPQVAWQQAAWAAADPDGMVGVYVESWTPGDVRRESPFQVVGVVYVDLDREEVTDGVANRG